MKRLTYVIIFILLLFAGKVEGQCVSVGTNQTICQGGITSPLNGTFGGDAAGPIWTDGSIGGTFTPGTNVLSPTWTPPISYTGTATLKLTASTGTCTPLVATMQIFVNPLPLAPTGSSPQSFCSIDNPTIANLIVTGTGIKWYNLSSGGTLLGSSTPLVTGTIYYASQTVAGCESSARLSVLVTVAANNTINMTSAAGSDAQTVCINTPISDITYTTTGPTGAAVTGLPSGVNWSWSANVVRIFGTPSSPGPFTYNITLTGGCGIVSASGTINVTPNNTIIRTSAVGTDAQVVCINTAITNITYTTTGATGATFTGLPAGVTGNWAANVVTISGIPAVSGPFNYTVSPTGGCGTITASGTITVNPLPIPTLTSSDADNIFCFGTSVIFTAGGGTNFNFRVGGATVQNGSSPTYTTTTLTNGQIVTVIVTNSNGCSATSSPIVNIVNSLPFIIISTPATCSTNFLTYSLAVTVPSSGIVTSTAGIVANTGGGVWTISGVLSGTNITVKVTDGGCENNLSVTAPNCNCPIVLPPVSGGDKSYCAGGVIPALTATVLTGETADWYSTSSGGAPLLSGSLSYTPTAPGTYYVLARNTTSNCVSGTRTPVILTMNPLPIPTITSSDADNIFCTGTSIIFTAGGGTGFNFRAGGVSVQNGASATYTTSTLANGQVVDVIVTNALGCTATSAAITNTVNALPVPTLTSSDADNKICAGTSVTFTGGGGTGYNFQVGGLSVQNGASATYTTSSLTNGQVVDVIVTNANGCTATSAGITNSVYVIPIANAGTGGNNCGLTFHLNGSLNVGTGTWAKVSGPGNVTFTPDANTAAAIVTVTAYGTYTFSWTVVNGTCSNSTNVTIVFIQQPATDAGSGGDVCTNNFNLKGVISTGTGTWTKATGPGNAVFTPDAHQANAKVTVDKFGAYDFEWTVVNSTCTSSGIVKVTFHDLPSINAGKDSTICKGGSIQLQAQGSGSVSWIPATLVSNPNIINPIATPDTTTTFTVNLTDQYGCKNSDNIVIGVRDRLIADAGPDQVLGFVFTTTMDAKLAHSYEKGVWRVISGTGEFLDSTYTSTAVSNLSIGTNEFLWLVTNGFCPASYDTVLIKVNNFVIPTLITPNMDGRNDFFVIRGLETVGKTELVIFDRRGAQVYKNMNYDNSWYGLDYNKNPLPDDTYFYVLKIGNGKSYSGYIVIRR